MSTKEQIRVYLDKELIIFLNENKENRNISDFLNNILKSYKELNYDRQIQISSTINQNQQK